MTAVYVLSIILFGGGLLLAAYWRYAASIPPWSDDESKEESCPRK